LEQTSLAFGKHDQPAASAWEDRFESGKHLVADTAPKESRICVARVLEHVQAQRHAVGDGRVAPHAEEWSYQPALTFRHCEQPLRGRARQCSHEDGLSLVVRCMTQRDQPGADPRRFRAECGMTSAASTVLHRTARLDSHRERAEFDPAIRRKFRDGAGLQRRSGTKPVIDVRDRETPSTRWGEARKHIEERARVGSPAARDQHVFAGNDDPAPVDSGGNRATDPSHRGGALTRRQGARCCVRGGGSWIRTRDIPGMNRLLYHLS
jgi:hypothetical protein